MDYQCDIIETPPLLLAACEVFTPQADVPAHIGRLYQVLYGWLAGAPVQQAGQNHVFYDRFGPDGMRMRVAFPVSGPFDDTGEVSCVSLPGMRTAHTRHSGAYLNLPQAHQAVNAWCEGRSLERLGLAWEAYGEFSDDESKLLTDIHIHIA